MTSDYRKSNSLITNESESLQARHFVLNSLRDCKTVKIASGYVGLGAFQEALEPFKKILENGGQVTLLFGLGYWEGISPALEKLLREFHNLAMGINAKSGVFFCQKQRFHGKFYIFENDEDHWASVGSSNFSDTGFGNWLESNVKLCNANEFKLLNEYFARLKKQNAKPINLLSFPSRKKELKKKVSKKNIGIPQNIKSLPIAFKLKIKPQPRSHINLFAGIGRKNIKGIYILRPWYEVELGVSKQEMKILSSFVPATKSPFTINLVDDRGDVMPALFKRKTPNSASSNTLLDGSDFMTKNRIELGRFIKDKLLDTGLLKYGELITADTLDTHGNDWLEFRAIPGKKSYYHITF
jgi:HKD family nuclease